MKAKHSGFVIFFNFSVNFFTISLYKKKVRCYNKTEMANKVKVVSFGVEKRGETTLKNNEFVKSSIHIKNVNIV